MDYLESKKIIKQAIFDEKLVIFVGSGVSKRSDIPLWGEVIKLVHDKLEKTIVDETDYLKIPQLYFNARGEKEYNELVKNILSYEDKNSNDIHDLIVKLNPCNVITTNYDDLIERAFKNNGEFLEVVERDIDIPYAKNSRMIIKMHGSFIHNNFVFKEDDYLNYSNNFPLIETYIKALIAKNIVLFIGYSYNDPDVKQIFNWTKHILGKDFQRAYLLDVNNKFDVANTDYYKNLGINVLYAKEILNDPKCDNPGEATKAFLEFIIEDKEETDILTKLYNEFLPFKSLNYVFSKYITIILIAYGNVYQNGLKLIISDLKLAEILRIKNNIDSNDKDAKEIENDKKREFIYSILNKTMITHVVYQERSQGIKEEVLFDFTNKNDDNTYFDSINNQNFSKLDDFINSVNLYDEKLDSIKALKVSFAFYELKNYTKCFSVLNKLSSDFKKKQDYVWHFIVEFNRTYLSKSWLIDEQLKKEALNIDLEDIFEKIKLENIISKNAVNEKRHNKFLKELLDFSLIYSTLLKISTKHSKVEVESKTTYSIMQSPAVYELELEALDLFNYLQFNFLMLNDFIEVKEVFKEYISSMFCAHSTK